MIQTMTRLKLRNSIIVVLVASIGAAGCATTQVGQTSATAQENADNECSASTAAIIGGILGALLTDGKNRVRGAALGAGLASLACVAWNYNSKQTKTAAQVEQEYKVANAGQLPVRSTVTRYESSLESGGTIARGKEMLVASNIEIVQGTADKSPVIEEEFQLSGTDGKEIKRTRKKANDNQGAGGYSTRFSIKMPEGVPQGEYPVQTVLYVNGERVAEKNLKVQVVSLPHGELVALVR